MGKVEQDDDAIVSAVPERQRKGGGPGQLAQSKDRCGGQWFERGRTALGQH